MHKAISDRIAKGRTTTAERDALLEKITATADYSALIDCDLIVEAVFEDRKVKAEVIKKIEAVIRDDAIFASNTSTLPITSLAAEFKDPARFIGIHFFSPVDRMLLTEVILGKKSGDKALAAALDYVRAIKKTPIVVNDSRGFYANRCVLNYIQEGHLMLLEGIPAAMIENTARMAGMPVGPLSLNDETASRSRPARSCAPPRLISARRVSPARADETRRGHGGEKWPHGPQERQGLLRLSARPAEAPVAGIGRPSAEETHA